MLTIPYLPSVTCRQDVFVIVFISALCRGVVPVVIELQAGLKTVENRYPQTGLRFEQIIIGLFEIPSDAVIVECLKFPVPNKKWWNLKVQIAAANRRSGELTNFSHS